MQLSVSEILNLWNKTLSTIEKKIGEKKAFDTFFDSSYIDSVNGDRVVLVAKTRVAATVLTTKYIDIIIESLEENSGNIYKVDIVSPDQVKPRETIHNETPKPIIVEPKNDYFQNSDVKKNLTFDNYVIGTFNRQAARAAQIVADKPGQKYNPLFIHSHSGLGKTHLLHAIGNQIKANTIGAKVIYMTAGQFVDEYIKHVTGDMALQDLKDFFNSVDLLLFDDVQFLAEKVKTQEMFFAIYESLVAKGKQIVIASDKQPTEIKGLEERLVTRFKQGLIVNINEPDVETCNEILKSKIKEEGLNPDRFDSDVLAFYAERYSKDIRELEGALNGLTFAVECLPENQRVTMEVALQAANEFLSSKNLSSQISEQRLINAVADYYQKTPSQLTSDTREAPIAHARQVAIYLIYTTMPNIPLKRIGALFGGRDHSTIKHSVEKIEKELKTNDKLRLAINKIKEGLN